MTEVSYQAVGAIPAFMPHESAPRDATHRPLLRPRSYSSDDEEEVVNTMRNAKNEEILRRRRIFLTVIAALGLASLASLIGYLLLGSNRYNGQPPPAPLLPGKLVQGKKGVVASELLPCSEIGTDMLEQGGNAVDAAVATAACLGVINCFSTGSGGGGFMIIRLPDATSEVIDYRETAPAGASKHMYDKRPDLSTQGGLAVAVPGEWRGLELAHKRHGKLPWKRLIKPSIKLARDGIPVTAYMERAFNYSRSLILDNTAFKNVFAPDGRLLQAGQVFTRLNYADTLEGIANSGADYIYRGKIAQRLADFVQANGGVLSASDLEMYKPLVREPLVGWYHGRRIITAPPPAAGAVLLAILNIIEGYEFAKGPSVLNDHRLVEAFKWAYAFRSELGDPAFVDVSDVIKTWHSKHHAERVRANISDYTTYPTKHYGGKFGDRAMHGTATLSTMDASGMAVSLTGTVNLLFGSKLMEPKTGIILNNEMDDFSSPGFNNSFGLPPSPANFIVPGKRPQSSSCPIVVERDLQVELALGGSGGSRITTGVASVLISMQDYDMDPLEAIVAKRFHHQLYPDVLLVEEGFNPAKVDALKQKGHNVETLEHGWFMSIVNACRRMADGTLLAASDPRKGGQASGV